MERHYDNGTEPDIRPHFAPRYLTCRGYGCYQGRQTCPHPDYCSPPAEAATELGADDDRPPLFNLGDLFLAIVCIIATAFVAGITYGVFTK